MGHNILFAWKYMLLALLSLELVKGSSNNVCFKEDSLTWRCNYIPKDIPGGFPRVRLVQFYDEQNVQHVCDYYFKTANWSNIEYLELRDERLNSGIVLKENCLIRLERLEELSFNIGGQNIDFEPGAFRGLKSVKILNMNDCFRMPIEKLSAVFERKDELPNIKTLSINRMLYYRGHVSLNEQFCKSILPRQIDYFEARGLTVDFFNISCFTKHFIKPLYLDMSSSVLVELYTGDLQSDMQHLKVLDFSYAIPPKSILNFLPGQFIIKDMVTSSKTLDLKNWSIFCQPEVIYYNGIIPRGVTLSVYNLTINIDEDSRCLVRTLHFRGNNIKRADIHLNCLSMYSFPSLEHLDVAFNGLEFINPSLISCIPNVKYIDLSNNNLYKMLDENIILFGRLFSSVKQLKTVLLANNKLHKLPSELFEANVDIEIIDLSDNSLEQIMTKFEHLRKLQMLDLRNNKIKILDRNHLSKLDSIPRRHLPEEQPQIMLESNPILCDQCDAETFLKWILKTDLMNITSKEALVCVSERRTKEHINDSSYEKVLRICVRRTIILSTCISSAGVTVVILLIAFITFTHRKRAKRRQSKDRIKRLVSEGEGQYQFVVMLAFSSEDELFVQDNVIEPLNEHLGLAFPEAERNLILTGDRYFRPGFYVHEEISASLERAAVVVIVVSRNYCESHYCREELDQAYILKKPIILMFKETVDAEIMMPTMNVLYKKYVRILWGEENGKYFLKTTWENVCRSITDLMLK